MGLSGRYAGRKAVIVKPSDEGTSDKPFSHALVAGIDQYPRKVTKKMSKKKQKVKVFFKHVNYSHFMPTRYSFTNATQLVNIGEVEDLLKKDVARTEKKEKRKEVARAFQEHVQKSAATNEKAAGAKWFMARLKF